MTGVDLVVPWGGVRRIHGCSGLQGKRLNVVIVHCNHEGGVLRCTDVSDSLVSTSPVHVREVSGEEELEAVGRIRAEAYYEV